jgi:hypothetical protein
MNLGAATTATGGGGFGLLAAIRAEVLPPAILAKKKRNTRSVASYGSRLAYWIDCKAQQSVVCVASFLSISESGKWGRGVQRQQILYRRKLEAGSFMTVSSTGISVA